MIRPLPNLFPSLLPCGALTQAGFAGPDPVCAIARTDWPEAVALARSVPLSPEEQARAARFRVQHARATFVLGRAILRRGLGAASGRAEADIDIRISPLGKPQAPDSGWWFSLSHSGPWVAAVFARAPIGCDLELGESLGAEDLNGIARQVFCPAERRALASLPPGSEAQRDFFLTVWRRKEAVLKAVGVGLGGAPCDLCVADAEGTLFDTVRCDGRLYRLRDKSGPSLPVLAVAQVVR